METFYSVIVMYNSEITDSQSCSRLEKVKKHKIVPIIVDNSTIANNNDKLCAQKGWDYISMGGNKGLSKAYNKVLDYLSGKHGVVIWFDDDSDITQEYFDELESSIFKNKESEIFVPVIRGQDGKFWSPNRARFFKNKQLKSIDEEIPNDQFNAINSCTAVKLDVYRNYRYDERLFLDQVDHKFFEDQRDLGRNFYKLNVVIQHNFSTREKVKDINKLKNRYKIMIPDFLIFCSSSRIKYLLGSIKVFGWGVRESIKSRNIYFLIWCLTELKKYPYKKIYRKGYND